MLFPYSAKMSRVPFEYAAFRSPDSLALMAPGDHHHRLAEFIYSDLFVRNLTSVDLLRVPGPMSQEPANFNRRLVTIGGRLLSVDRNLPRHEIQYWLNALADDTPERQSFTASGFTVRETIDWTRDVPCHGDSWNPSGGPSFDIVSRLISAACPTNRRTGALRAFLYRKDGVWYTRYEGRSIVSAPDEMAPLEGAPTLDERR